MDMIHDSEPMDMIHDSEIFFKKKIFYQLTKNSEFSPYAVSKLSSAKSIFCKKECFLYKSGQFTIYLIQHIHCTARAGNIYERLLHPCNIANTK